MRKPGGWMIRALAFTILSCVSAAGQDRPLTAADVVALLGAGTTPAEVGQLVKERGYRGGAEADDLKRLKDAGADAGLLMQIRDAAGGPGIDPIAGAPSGAGQAAPTAAAPLPQLPRATSENPFVNSLGMKFVPVPGTQVLFCIWETRVRDYETFVKESGFEWKTGRLWTDMPFTQTPDHAAMLVKWDDAKAFCAWLSQKEGRLYRLPSEQEWEAAVGTSKYPWGESWPPPQRAGNYNRKGDGDWMPESIILGSDGYHGTAPVGSFSANRNGLYDIGGNVWEWCEDLYDSEHPWHVLRGGSYVDDNPDSLASSRRYSGTVGGRGYNIGFRCVVAASSP